MQMTSKGGLLRIWSKKRKSSTRMPQFSGIVDEALWFLLPPDSLPTFSEDHVQVSSETTCDPGPIYRYFTDIYAMYIWLCIFHVYSWNVKQWWHTFPEVFFFVSQRKRMSQVLPEVLFSLNFTSLLTRAGTSSAKNTQAYQTSSDIIRYQDFLVIFRSDPMPIQGKHLQSVSRYVQNPGTSSSATPISAVDHLEISLCHCRWCLGYPIHRCLVVG